ncbi:MAG: methylenetetrahydrofolate reductase [Candidatus Aureabacteria bacterium]|nr:methylenetetrahydrofolate reductase [Candidatus Auribacterota bacterium]
MNIFAKKIINNAFVVTTELFPPKGPDVEDFLKKARSLKGYFDAYNVTDNQRAIMRLSPVACSMLLKNEGMEPIFQLTCRDRNRIAIQSELLAAEVIGAHNILCLTGDYITAGDHPEAKAVFDIDSIQLLDLINKLNNGKNFNNKELNGKCDFFSGAAINPCGEPREVIIDVLKRKKESGAKFIQTQVIFDLNIFKDFCEEVKELKTNIIAGIFLIKSAKNARFLNKNIPGINIPSNIIDILEKSDDPISSGISYAADLIARIKEEKICSGVHIMCIGMEEKAKDIIKKAGLNKLPQADI